MGIPKGVQVGVCLKNTLDGYNTYLLSTVLHIIEATQMFFLQTNPP